MSEVFGFAGDEFSPVGLIYPNSKETLFLPLGSHVDVYYPSRKRARISALPRIIYPQKFDHSKRGTIEVLPDECLFEIFIRLAGNEERSTCACVSKRWLTIMSNISKKELRREKIFQSENQSPETNTEEADFEGGGCLTRNLEGKMVTDMKLAAIAVGTAGHGGLGKLIIRGNGSCKVTDHGLRAISCGCPSLRILSLWNLPFVGDDALFDVANRCHLLEKLDLCHCPKISDKSLLSIAKNCPNLTDLAIESCSGISNEGLQFVGKYCSNLKSISIKDCPLVGDQGVAGLISFTTFVLTKVKLQALNITDVSLAVIGHYGKAVTDLVLTGLPCVGQRGFWVMGNGHGLQKLKSLAVTACPGMTDIGLEAVARGCPNMRQFSLRQCAFLSDNGLGLLAKAAISLESFQLEECQGITQAGIFSLLSNCSVKLKSLHLSNCFGMNNQVSDCLPPLSSAPSLRTLSICNCPGFGDDDVSVLGKLCSHLQNLELAGLPSLSDGVLLPLLESIESGLVKVNLSGCVGLTDKVVSVLAELHGWTLQVLNLDGCKNVTDESLEMIAGNCISLSDLDLSECAITDSGIASLANSGVFNPQILSVSGCSMISDSSVPEFLKFGSSLMGFNLKHCDAMSSSAIDFLLDQLWRCDILS